MKAAAIVAVAFGAGSLVLQRWVASTRLEAIALVVAWFLVLVVAAVIYARSHPGTRKALLATMGAVLIGSVAVGWWTGFRDRTVDEDIVVASSQASGREREAGLSDEQASAGQAEKAQPGPVSLLAGMFAGQDGHSGTGKAEVVKDADGARTLTFSEFDVDPGADVDVFLTPSAEGIDGGIELGGLKGNVGDQQYEIPADADLGEYDSVVLWCTPFTVRIATAELS